MGYFSGYASYCLGKSVYFVERECRGKGDERCLAVGRDVNSWGQEIAKDLPYFHATDIQGRIQALSNQFARKSWSWSGNKARSNLRAGQESLPWKYAAASSRE